MQKQHRTPQTSQRLRRKTLFQLKDLHAISHEEMESNRLLVALDTRVEDVQDLVVKD